MQKLFCPKREGTDKISLIQSRRVKKFLNQSIKTENVKPDTFLFFNDGSMLAFKAADAAKCTNDSVAGEKLCAKNLAYSYIIHESPSNILCFRKSITH